MIRILLRYLFRILSGIFIFIASWLLLAFVLPYLKTSGNTDDEEKKISIFILSNGVHTDFVMPVKTEIFNWNKLLPYSDFEVADPSYEYVSMGWGDKGFFIGTPTWADLKFSTAFKAAFGLSTTAMHVTYKHYEPKENESCRRLEISVKQYKLLIRYIVTSFQVRNAGFVVIDHPGYTPHDRFYEANGSYSLFKTCNVWTGNGLQLIGVSTGVWTPLSGGVLQGL